jgi:hypothetical protein
LGNKEPILKIQNSFPIQFYQRFEAQMLQQRFFCFNWTMPSSVLQMSNFFSKLFLDCAWGHIRRPLPVWITRSFLPTFSWTRVVYSSRQR